MPFGYPFALQFGGGPDDFEVAQNALLEAMRPYLDPADPAQIALTNAEALAIAITWAVNRRLAGQLNPMRMIETLPTWETACGIRPQPSATWNDRRKALAAQFLGYVGNAIANIYAVCVAVAGPSFLGLYIPPSNATNYLPGLNPGPPGFENATMRATVGVRLAPVGVSDANFLSLVRQMNRSLSLMCPAWMTFTVGTDEGHAVCDIAVCDRTLLMD